MAILTAYPTPAVGTAAETLTIPLDHVPESVPKVAHPEPNEGNGAPKRRPVLRRDSMNRREALLKGKEGSRRRHRWENGSSPPENLTIVHSMLTRAPKRQLPQQSVL